MHVNVYFTDQNIMQRDGLNFKGLEIQKWNKPTDGVERLDDKKDSFVSLKCKTWPFYINLCKKYNSKKLETVWARCLSAPGRSYWFFCRK